RGRRDEEKRAVCIQMHDRCADTVEPANCIQRDRAGVAEDDEALQLAVDPAEHLSSPIGSDAIVYDQVTALDSHAEPIATQYLDSCWRTDRRGHRHDFRPFLFGRSGFTALEIRCLMGQSTRAYGLVGNA